MLSGLYELRNALSRQPIIDNNGKWYFRKVDISAETVDSFDRCKLFFKKYASTQATPDQKGGVVPG
jgi:hypothetical protein